MKEVSDSEFEITVDMAILAVGFVHPEHEGLVADLALELDEKGNVKTDDRRMTSVPGIFAAGDARRGQSLVVWAIDEGRRAAEEINTYLCSRKQQI